MGAVVSTLGCVVPSCIIVMVLAYIYYRFRGLTVVQGVLAGLRPAVIAMIASAGISLFFMSLYGQQTLPSDATQINLPALAIFLVGFIFLRKWKTNPIYVMAAAVRQAFFCFRFFDKVVTSCSI